jgi:uncharacterized membrane protein
LALISPVSARLRGLGAPVASIGGGAFDGIFLTEIIAALLESLVV